VTSNYVGVLLNRAKAALRDKLRAHRPLSLPESLRKETSR
jgi:hypothetical protein